MSTAAAAAAAGSDGDDPTVRYGTVRGSLADTYRHDGGGGGRSRRARERTGRDVESTVAPARDDWRNAVRHYSPSLGLIIIIVIIIIIE